MRAPLKYLESSLAPLFCRTPTSPSPAAVPRVPSSIIWMMLASGHGTCLIEPRLQVPVPLWDCMRPGFATPLSVLWTRTQPFDS